MKFMRHSLVTIVTAAFPLLLACAHPHTAADHSTSDSTFVLHDDSDINAVKAAYHERLRLGLGSPFRLIEIAARDTRLEEAARSSLLRELFARTASGDTYDAVHTLPLAHQRVIEHAMSTTRDPRIAELAVNLAYELAVAEKSVSPEVQYAAASTAALLRDRGLAKIDAQRVREHARLHNQEPHTLVPALRAQRMLIVEQPLQIAMNDAAQEEAARIARLLVGGVRHAARQQNHAQVVQARTLARSVAERILALQRTHERPPQSALIVAMRVAQLPFSARDEETFVAELALAPEHAQLAAQRAAIALRPFAQERIWHAQSQGPSTADLLVRYGVRVAFMDDVPKQWRPWYRAQLEQALTQMQLVLPSLNLKGLTIEVGDVDPAAGHLAYHDPRARTIRWAPATGAGSLAHEIGHDLDWQIARRAYRRKAGYASDYATDVAAMMALTRTEMVQNERPTETLARQFDWLIAASLAETGRMNGHLSSVQHDWLPGHGAARPTTANVQSANALAGTIARARSGGSGDSDRIERTVLAPALPAAVHAVRNLRRGLEPARASAASPETKMFTQELLVAHGQFRFAKASTETTVPPRVQPFQLQVMY